MARSFLNRLRGNDNGEPDSAGEAFERSPAWQALGWRAWTWREQFRRSRVALQLFDLFGDPDRYRTLLGDQGYRDAVIDLLGQATPPDGEAAGMEPDGSFLDWTSDECSVQLHYSESLQHRAILWREPPQGSARLWVDGTLVTDPRQGLGVGAQGFSTGQWIRDRYFVMAVAAPDDHPGQKRSGLSDDPLVQGLLIWDATARQVRSIEMPDAGEVWHIPVLFDAGTEWRILGNEDRIRSQQPWADIAPVRVLSPDTQA